jgi:hypothetical protein
LLCVLPQVYASLQPKAHFLQLLDDGAGLTAAWEAFKALEAAIGVLNWYYALNGISILLLIARWVSATRLGSLSDWRSQSLNPPVLRHVTDNNTSCPWCVPSGCCEPWTSSPGSGS